MARIFSDHVASLDAESSIDSGILKAIKDVLRSELRRRGILEYGPSLLGYLGNSWNDHEAMDDLAHDCYVRAILTRLRGLRANLKLNGDIEQLVRRNIRSFVGERQAKFDPIGHAVFQNLKASILELTEAGDLTRLESESEPISGASQFASAGRKTAELATDIEVKEALRHSGQILDGLEGIVRIGVTAQERLVCVIKGLPAQRVFRFSVTTLKTCLCDLITEADVPLNVARETRIADLHADFAENLRTIDPDAGYEEEEDFRKLVVDLMSEVGTLSRSSAVKSRLRQLLASLAKAVENDEAGQSMTLDEMARGFGVARSTLHDDFQCLRELVRRRHQGPIPREN